MGLLPPDVSAEAAGEEFDILLDDERLFIVSFEFIEHGGTVAVGLATMGNECVGKDFACWTGVAEADETGGVFVVLLAGLGMRDVVAEFSFETVNKVSLLFGGEALAELVEVIVSLPMSS